MVFPGKVIDGRFRLEQRLGSGGHGEVWRATDTKLGRQVALKRELSGTDDVDPARLREEARIAASLNHPNVVTVHDVVFCSGAWWLVMEYVPSENLRQAGLLAPERVIEIGAQLAGALAALHRQGIFHRDLKPGNVLLTADGRAKLADFGISRAVHEAETLTRSGLIPGTPGYVAPEVAGGGDFSKSSDVFSLGATLFTAAEGASPYGTGNGLTQVRRAIERDIDAPRRAGELEPVLRLLLDPDPTRRPDAEEAHRLLTALAGTPVAGKGTGRRHGRGRTVAGSVAVVSVAVLALIAWAALRPSSGAGEGVDPSESAVSGAAHEQPPSPVSGLFGDPATADPCALLDPNRFSEHGTARLDVDRGEFNRCDVMVFQGDSGAEVDVRVLLDHFGDGPPSGDVEPGGDFGVLTPDSNDGACDRLVLLPNDDHVFVGAERSGEGFVTENDAAGCAIVETAVRNVLEVLDRGVLPRRGAPFAAGSLATLDACGLASFPDAEPPEPGFSDWQCWWRDTDADRRMSFYFDRQGPSDEAGDPFDTASGRRAYVEAGAWGEHTCVVDIEHRRYVDVQGDDVVEVLRVVVYGDDPAEKLCDLAVSLAEVAAPKLPPV